MRFIRTFLFFFTIGLVVLIGYHLLAPQKLPTSPQPAAQSATGAQANPTTIFAKNQFQAYGPAACACIAAAGARYHLTHPGKCTYTTALLNTWIQSGVQAHGGGEVADTIEDAFGKFGLALSNPSIPGTFAVPFLSSKVEIRQSLNQADYSVMILKNGPEAWLIIRPNNGGFWLFDSHGKTSLHPGDSRAFIKLFTSARELADFIWSENPLKDDLRDPNLNEQQKQDAGIYCYKARLAESA